MFTRFGIWACFDSSCVILKGKEMKLVRYRKPSVKTVIGVTKAKNRINKAVGITAVKKPFRAPGNAKRSVLRHAGYYSEPFKLGRFLGRLFGR